jgi:hypothetical protein
LVSGLPEMKMLYDVWIDATEENGEDFLAISLNTNLLI